MSTIEQKALEAVSNEEFEVLLSIRAESPEEAALLAKDLLIMSKSYPRVISIRKIKRPD